MGAARELAERYVGLYNSGDLDQLLDMYASDAVSITPDGPSFGQAAIAEQLAAEHAAFPDRQLKPVLWVEAEDRVAVEYAWSGTHTGPIRCPGEDLLPATGEQIGIGAVGIFHVRRGKISAHRTYLDRLPPARQLGAPAAGRSGAQAR